MKKKAIVYWTQFTALDRITTTNLLFESPKHIWTTLPKDGIDSYRACSATKGFFNNTYVINNPIDLELTISNNGTGIVPDDGVVFINNPAYSNQHTISLDYSWLFFSEDNINVAIYPPYLHNTTSSKYGAIHAGSFNISKWFRPVVPQYTLWENVNNFKSISGEPIMYVDFQTDDKVELRQFELTPEIVEVVRGVLGFKYILPRTTLKELYHRFISSKRDKRLLKLIKENIL
jgi:hypothetical protein